MDDTTKKVILLCDELREDACEIARKFREYRNEYSVFLLSIEEFFYNFLHEEICHIAKEVYSKEQLEEYYRLRRGES